MEQKGFTIIELAISIFVLSVGVIGVFGAFFAMTLLTSNIDSRLTATYLAQEGMEIVRNIRDTNWLKMNNGVPGVTWLSGLNGCSDGCGVEYTDEGPITRTSESYLKIDSNGFYSYQDCPQEKPNCATKFKRKVKITCLDNSGLPDDSCNAQEDYVIKVVVEVSWDERATILHPTKLDAGNCGNDLYNCIRAQLTLYDWYNHNVAQ